MNNLQKVIDFYPKGYLISNYIVSIFLTFMLLNGLVYQEAPFPKKILVGILFLIMGILYPYSKGYSFKPNRSNTSINTRSLLGEIVITYVLFVVVVIFNLLLAPFLGLMNLYKIIKSDETYCSWYDTCDSRKFWYFLKS